MLAAWLFATGVRPASLSPSSCQITYAKEIYTHAHRHRCIQQSSAIRQGSLPSPEGQEGGCWAVSCAGEGKPKEQEQKQQRIRQGCNPPGLSSSAWSAWGFIRADGNSSFGSGAAQKGYSNPFCWLTGSWLASLSVGGWLSSAGARGWSGGVPGAGGSEAPQALLQLQRGRAGCAKTCFCQGKGVERDFRLCARDPAEETGQVLKSSLAARNPSAKPSLAESRNEASLPRSGLPPASGNGASWAGSPPALWPGGGSSGPL